MIYTTIASTIGQTPVVKLKNTSPDQADIYVKLEYFNPAGSVKDRVARNMVQTMQERGEINDNTVLVEPTSGNTGIGIAMMCATLGLKFIAVMPENLSDERKKLLKAYGATLVLTEVAKGMAGAIEKATELASQPNHIMLKQFENPLNPEAHIETAKEIIADFDTLDCFVAGVGTGGTVVGTGKVLKEHYKNIEIVAVEPANSPFLSENVKGPHMIQGIGAGFRPAILDLGPDVMDTILTVTDEDAMAYARLIGKKDGILFGFSGGAAYRAAQVKAEELGKGKKVLFIAADNGERYLSTKLCEE